MPDDLKDVDGPFESLPSLAFHTSQLFNDYSLFATLLLFFGLVG